MFIFLFVIYRSPEFTETRICQLLSMLSELMFPDTATTADVHTARQATMTPDSSSIAVNGVVSSNDPFRKCLELCSAIITDHIRGPFMLTDRQFLQLIELCFGQISCHRSQCTWTLVQSWSELTLLLLRSSVKSIVSLSSSMSGPGLDEGNSLASLDGSHISIDVNRKIALVMLHKADALSRLNQHNQALEVVSAAVKTLQDPSTLTTSFLITLRAQGGQSAVSSLITLLDTSHTRKTTSGLTDTISRPTSLWKDTHHLSTQSLVSDLDILVICLKQVLDVEVNSNLTSECVIAQTLLLKEWLRRYQQSRHWRTTVDRSDTAVNENISYFAFTSEVIRRFLNKFMHSVEKVKPTINKSDTIAQTSFVASVSGITSDNTIHSSKRPLESAVENSQSKRMHIEPTDADTHKDTAHIADICAAIDSSVAVSNSNGAVEVVTSTAMITTDPVDSTASQETKVQGGDSCPMEDTPLATPLTTQMATDEGEIVTSVLVTDAPTLDSDSSNNKNKVAEATAEKETAALDERTSDETKQHVLSSSFNEKQPSKAQRIQTLFDEDANSQYEFMCRVEDLRDEVLCMLEDTLRTVEMAMSDDVDLQLLGSPKHLEWLPEVAWNLSAVVLREKSCKFQGSIASNMMTDETQLSNSEETVQRLLLGADFAEKADLLYALVPYEDRALSRQNQSTCLLVASGARLTVDVALLTRHSKADAKSTGGAFSGSSLSLSKTNDLIVASSSHSSANETVRENLAAVERNCVKVDTMMRSSLSFAVDEQLQTIRRINMIFHFTLMCKLGGEKLSAFVKERKLELLQLSAEKLIECSDIARQERGGTAEAVRAMLLLAQQVCMREQITRKSPLNTVFVRLIEFSNSREQALAKIEEFEQLLLRGGKSYYIYL